MKLDYIGYSNDKKVIDYIKTSKMPVVIAGNGSVGQAVAKKLKENDIKDFAMASVKIDEKNNIQVLESIPYDCYVLLYGYLGMYCFKPEKCLKPFGCDKIFYLTELYDAEKITYDFIKKHESEFENTLNCLEDELSKDSFIAFLNSKINEKAIGLSEYVIKPQYFGVDFIKCADEEVFVDCGAYDGDSIKAFLKWNKGKYSLIFAFEPDEENANKLERFLNEENIHNAKVLRIGAYNEKTELKFQNNQMMSKIAKLGGGTEHCTAIMTEKIDNIMSKINATFIKMDIEGSEMQALQGAMETIKRCRPTLAISAYHRKEDLITFPQLIKQCWNGYRFYFRLHKELPIDAVLYAIP